MQIKKVILLFLISLSASAASKIPEKFQLHVMMPNISARDIEISHDSAKSRYWISYLKMPNGQRVKKQFSASTVEALYADLWKMAPNYAEWQSDIDCIRRETWRLEVDSVKKRVCYSPKIEEALSKLEKTVALLLR